MDKNKNAFLVVGKQSYDQEQIKELISTINYHGEDDGYFKIINDVMLPCLMAYMAQCEERNFGTISNEEFLDHFQCLQHVLIALREFSTGC